MVPQFFKLAVHWDVWPGVRVGKFIYPCASSLAALLLDEHAVVTLKEVNGFAFQAAGELAAFRETMRRIVKRVEIALSASREPKHEQYLRGLARSKHPLEWEVASDVDFALWSRALEMNRRNSFKEWRLDKDGLVVRKQAV